MDRNRFTLCQYTAIARAYVNHLDQKLNIENNEKKKREQMTSNFAITTTATATKKNLSLFYC